MATQSITVEQWSNPRFNSAEPVHPNNNSEYIYRVVKAVNTLKVAVGARLTQTDVMDLIEKEFTVNIQAPNEKK